MMDYIPQSPSAYECDLINQAETTIQKPLEWIAKTYSGDFQSLYFFSYLYAVTVFFKLYGEMPSSFERLRAFMFWQM